jgi:signal transduction histidine kinase
MGAGMTSAFRSARGRILASVLGLLAFSTVASILLVREVMLVRLSDSVEESLVQESQEFSQLVGGRDPNTGRRFGTDVEAIFDVFLRRNVPAQDEVLLTFVAGRPYKSSASRGYPLDELRGQYGEWASLTRAQQSSFETSAGPARALAVPIVIGDRNRGTFVVVDFLRRKREDTEETVRILAAVTLGVLLVASMLAWLVAGRVLAPLRDLRRTAQSITETDLTRRIEVQGDDELADLARTFNDMLDRLEAVIGSQKEFISDAGHELRTPITIVRGHLELMGGDPDERRETVELVMDELDRMSRLVDDLLLLAKAQRPDFLDPKELDLDLVIREVLAKASALAPRDWQLEKAGAGLILADRQRLTQAVVNLSHNAVQHTRDGDPIVLGADQAYGEARFWVRDTGTGIPPEDRERIFERFAQGGDPARRRDRTGLGLAIVRAIAEAHGGRVELATRVGEGSTFTIIIPTEAPEVSNA